MKNLIRTFLYLFLAVAFSSTLVSRAYAEAITLGGDRPAELYIPGPKFTLYPRPLILFLHGYGSTGPNMNNWLHAADDANRLGYIALIPEGSPDAVGLNFWNATADCCNFHDSERDDVSYLEDLIKEAKRKVWVGKVYIIGHSNGGFMASRLTCDKPNLIDGVVSIAGGFFRDPKLCKNPRRTPLVQIHGTEDSTIPYWSNDNFPGAFESVWGWSEIYGCSYTTLQKEAKDLVTFSLNGSADGNETDVLNFGGCKFGVKLSLWTVNGGSHNILFSHIVEEAMSFF